MPMTFFLPERLRSIYHTSWDTSMDFAKRWNWTWCVQRKQSFLYKVKINVATLMSIPTLRLPNTLYRMYVTSCTLHLPIQDETLKAMKCDEESTSTSLSLLWKQNWRPPACHGTPQWTLQNNEMWPRVHVVVVFFKFVTYLMWLTLLQSAHNVAHSKHSCSWSHIMPFVDSQPSPSFISQRELDSRLNQTTECSREHTVKRGDF